MWCCRTHPHWLFFSYFQEITTKPTIFSQPNNSSQTLPSYLTWSYCWPWSYCWFQQFPGQMTVQVSANVPWYAWAYWRLLRGHIRKYRGRFTCPCPQSSIPMQLPHSIWNILPFFTPLNDTLRKASYYTPLPKFLFSNYFKVYVFLFTAIQQNCEPNPSHNIMYHPTMRHSLLTTPSVFMWYCHNFT